jgi:S1-C subfamily serine protease
MRRPVILTTTLATATIAAALVVSLLVLPAARETISRATVSTEAEPTGVVPGDAADAPTSSPTPTMVAQPEPDIAAKVAPSVVKIQIESNAGSDRSGGHQGETQRGQASGVKIAAGIVTNDHVVADEERVQVVASDGRQGTAVVIRRAPALDLVLLQSDLDLPPLELEGTGEQRQGEAVLVFGYPRPDVLGPGPEVTLTRGLISAIRRDQEGVGYIQTDAAVDPGSSGGAMVNLRGQLIGIPTFGLRGSPSLSFAVRTDAVQSLVHGTSSRPVAPGPVYRAAPGDLLLTPNDLGSDWKAAGGPSAVANDDADVDVPSDGQQTDDEEEQPTATAQLVRGKSTDQGPGFAVLISSVRVEDDATRAHTVWERSVRHPPGGLVRQPDPDVADECRAYRQAMSDRAEIHVLCREENVVIGVAMEGASDVATYAAVAFYTGIMTERVRSGAQEPRAVLTTRPR